MTIPYVVPIKAYTGNGVANSFAYPFKIFAATDMVVTVDGVTKAYGGDYALTGVGNDAGGNVVFVVAPANLTAVLLFRQIPYDRLLSDYQEAGDFLAETVNKDLDRGVGQVQQVARDISRAIKLPVDVLADQVLASTVAQRVGKIVGFDSSGNVILFDPAGLTSSAVSVFMQGVVVAANSAAALAAIGADAKYIANAFVANKGDLIGASANDVPAIVAVGADGLQLTGDTAQAAGLSYQVRNLERSQCPLAGVVDANGAANFLTVGAGLKPGLTATAAALLLAFGSGYDAGGNVDLTALISADNADIIGANLPVSNTNFIHATRTSPTAVTWGSSLAPPQARETYDQTKQSVLQFGGAPGATVFLDDFGNTWVAQGNARVQTNQFKFGTGGLGGGGAANVLNGTTDYIKTTSITSLGFGGWAMRAWVYCTVLPGVGVTADIMGAVNAGGFGARFNIFNNAGVIKFAYAASADGATVFINNVQGTTTPVINTWYFVEYTFDALAGVYRLYVNGAQESSTANTQRICAVTNVGIGAAASFFTGYIDKPEILPYCQHPAGTAYANPAGAPDVTVVGYASEWYDIVKRKLWGVTAASAAAGVNPTFTARTKVYVGECDTSGAAVTAARSYAYRGKYVSDDFPATTATITTKTHNIGSVPRSAVAKYVQQNGEANWSPGEIYITSNFWDGTPTARNPILALRRNTIVCVQSALGTSNFITAAAFTPTSAANLKIRIEADRGW